MAQSDKFNMQNFQEFKAVAGSVCNDLDTGRMPFAEVPYNRFWGTAIDKPAMEQLLHDISGTCALTRPH